MLSHPIQSHPSLPTGGAAAGAPPFKSETLMLTVQLLVAKDFDEQMRRVGDQMRFLSGIKKNYRDQIAKLQNFLTANPNGSRKDGKKYVEATFAQMAGLCGSLTRHDYDLETLTLSETGFPIPSGGDRHGLDDPDADDLVWAPIANGAMNARDLADYFAHGGAMTDTVEASDFAARAGDDGNGLFFYRGHGNATDEKGAPKFSVLVDQLERLTEGLKNRLSGTEEDAERLSARLAELSAQRKAALEGADQLVKKMEQIRSHAIGKTA